MTSDAPTDKAIKELQQRVYDRDHADPEDRDAPVDFAYAFMLWLRTNGWKHVPPPAAPVRTPAPGTARRGAEHARHLLAQTRKGDGDDR